MIKLFTIRRPIVFITLVFMVLLLRLPSFLISGTHSGDFIHYTFFEGFLVFLNQTKTTSYVIGCCIVIFQMLHLSYLFEKHAIHYKNTYLPALFYALFASLLNGVDVNITPALLAQTPLMLALSVYFGLYKSSDAKEKILTSMLVLGVGFLLYLPMAYLILVFWIGLFYVKIPTLRDYLIAAIGALLPLYFVFVFCFYDNRLPYFVEKINLLVYYRGGPPFEETKPELFLLGALALILIFSSVKIYTFHFKNNIKTRIIQKTLLVLSVVILSIILFVLPLNDQHLLFFLLPFSYLASYFFMGTWRFFLNEIIAMGLLTFIIILKIYRL